MADESGDGSAGTDPDATTSDPFAPVYQPAEDSALLAGAAESHARGVVLEVGTGSGWVAERVGGSPGVDRVVGNDPNPHACRAATDRGVAAVRGDLTTPFAADAFDTVLFNPPYLPAVGETDDETSDDGVRSGDGANTDWGERALVGGETGRALIEPFLSDLGRVLRPDGVGLLLVSSLAGFGAVVEHAVACEFHAETITEESFPFETLSVLRLTHDD